MSCLKTYKVVRSILLQSDGWDIKKIGNEVFITENSFLNDTEPSGFELEFIEINLNGSYVRGRWETTISGRMIFNDDLFDLEKDGFFQRKKFRLILQTSDDLFYLWEGSFNIGNEREFIEEWTTSFNFFSISNEEELILHKGEINKLEGMIWNMCRELNLKKFYTIRFYSWRTLLNFNKQWNNLLRTDGDLRGIINNKFTLTNLLNSNPLHVIENIKDIKINWTKIGEGRYLKTFQFILPSLPDFPPIKGVDFPNEKIVAVIKSDEGSLILSDVDFNLSGSNFSWTINMIDKNPIGNINLNEYI